MDQSWTRCYGLPLNSRESEREFSRERDQDDLSTLCCRNLPRGTIPRGHLCIAKCCGGARLAGGGLFPRRGVPDAGQHHALRLNCRDDYLAGNPGGRRLIDFYLASPPDSDLRQPDCASTGSWRRVNENSPGLNAPGIYI